MARPIISVILSGKNEANNIAACFEALAAQKCKVPFEVHYVDNASTDGSYAQARKVAKSLGRNFFVWKEKKPGIPATKNYGAQKARGKILLFSNIDCVPSPKWIQEISTPLLEPSPYPLAAVGGNSQSLFKSKPNIWERYSDSLYHFWEENRTSAKPVFLPWSPASNFAIKKEIFDAIGGFDENWKFAAYDVDLSWRLVLCGFMIGYAPNAVVKRKRKSTLKSLLRQMEKHAYYQHSLISTYEKILGLSKLSVQHKRIMEKSKRFLTIISDPKELAQIKLRAAESLVLLSAGKGALEAGIIPAKANKKLNPTRKGDTPKKILRYLPRGYAHLHHEGYVYWKFPADLGEEGSLMLYQPKKRRRIQFSPLEWKIWEIKSEKGQSEDVASAMGEKEDNAEVLNMIDELTLKLHTRRLLPAQ